VRRRIAAGVVAVALLGGGYLWLRDSSLVAVTEVTVTGLTGRDAPAVRAALVDAARDMTTMHVRVERLRTAARPYPAVKDLEVTSDFPHAMRIHVIEHDPVAALDVRGRRVAIAADGTLLTDQAAGSQLVVLDVPTASGGGRLTDRRALAAVRAMAAAPRALRPYVTGVAFGSEGLRVSLRSGPTLELGDARRARAKWAAAARVLADPRAAGASYLDVRVPDRPVAGRFQDPRPEVETAATLNQESSE
jgi:cell division protein FtsQ